MTIQVHLTCSDCFSFRHLSSGAGAVVFSHTCDTGAGAVVFSHTCETGEWKIALIPKTDSVLVLPYVPPVQSSEIPDVRNMRDSTGRALVGNCPKCGAPGKLINCENCGTVVTEGTE